MFRVERDKIDHLRAKMHKAAQALFDLTKEEEIREEEVPILDGPA